MDNENRDPVIPMSHDPDEMRTAIADALIDLADSTDGMEAGALIRLAEWIGGGMDPGLLEDITAAIVDACDLAEYREIRDFDSAYSNPPGPDAAPKRMACGCTVEE